MGAEWAGEAYLQQQCLLKPFYWSMVALRCCVFLLWSRVHQPHGDTHLLWISFPSGRHGALSGLPCAVQQVLVSYRMQSTSSVFAATRLRTPPTPFLPLRNRTFVLSICESGEALFLKKRFIYLLAVRGPRRSVGVP